MTNYNQIYGSILDLVQQKQQPQQKLKNTLNQWKAKP